MMDKRMKFAGLVAGVLLSVFAATAEAGPITGALTITGNLVPVYGVPPVPSSLGQATAIDFDGTFLVSQATGSLWDLAGLTGTIQDFSFNQPASFPAPPILAFESVGDLTFDLMQVTLSSQSNWNLRLHGWGIFHRPGFDDTWGDWFLKANLADNSFSFTATQRVPEPATLVLMGLGLIAGGSFLRHRSRLSA